ncbi:endospore germination permease [Paenibacillus sp. NFR01]|uniref:GerAB/ArcD/ProY family transporter n=1 Tax=Paenibacillus sp. NFR01 TaxID=1566279 RepID=UPI0008AFB39F|nr:endospore germination permease [Paenibacillus sp. NFR01]SET61515.1 spore germination protein KB [Paenibacillus sp. NFR01]
MYNQSHVRVSELAITFALFEIGSTSLFLIGGDVKQDAWLAMLIGALAGFLLLLIHLTIHRIEPRLDLFQIFQSYTGKSIGGLLSLGFVGYFMLEASRNLRDIAEVTILTLLPETPLWSVMLIIILVVSNTIRYGPETLFLMCIVLFPLITTGYLIIVILLAANGLIHFHFMLPVLEHGWIPILKAAIPGILSFPFGQIVVFLVFYPLTASRRQMGRKMIWTYCGISLFLIFINQINVLVLGPVLASNSALPLLQTVQLIQMTEVLERIDPLFTIILFLSLGIKMATFFNGAAIGTSRITGIKHKKSAALIGAGIYFLGFLSPTYTEFIKVGREIAVKYWWPIFQVALPVLLLMVILIRKSIRMGTGRQKT